MPLSVTYLAPDVGLLGGMIHGWCMVNIRPVDQGSCIRDHRPCRLPLQSTEALCRTKRCRQGLSSLVLADGHMGGVDLDLVVPVLDAHHEPVFPRRSIGAFTLKLGSLKPWKRCSEAGVRPPTYDLLFLLNLTGVPRSCTWVGCRQ